MSAPEAAVPPQRDTEFTIAVLPDTQNYIDYTHQTAEGFPFDASEMFLDQMQYVAENLVSVGGEIAFVTSLGDVWQHPTLLIDEGHAARGFRRAASPVMDQYFAPTEETLTVEMPTAHEGFALIAGKTPFSVVPGNHDYDATWVDSKFPPKAMTREEADPDDPLAFGMLHPGGLDNFRAVFGADTPFFKDQPWYVASHDGGADSAQIFSAGGYRFLHIGLQFDPPDASLEWAASVMQAHKGLPTIISTHDYMNRFGERIPSRTLDGHAVDPIDNSPEMIWDKLIRQNDQVFLVLCGHQLGQGLRVDDNVQGHKVWQVLSDYQDRKQTAIEAGRPDTPIGDGWMRLMTFDMAGPVPLIRVKTYSTHYHALSRDTAQYAKWYKQAEKPDLTDEAFNDEDDFVMELEGFRERFESARLLTTVMVSGAQSGK
ncbi:MAG: metallophosphoesterase [Hyphomonas sp.]